MNDPGLDDVIQHAEVKLNDEQHYYPSQSQDTSKSTNERKDGGGKAPPKQRRKRSHHHEYDDPEAAGLYQPTYVFCTIAFSRLTATTAFGGSLPPLFPSSPARLAL